MWPEGSGALQNLVGIEGRDVWGDDDDLDPKCPRQHHIGGCDAHVVLHPVLEVGREPLVQDLGETETVSQRRSTGMK